MAGKKPLRASSGRLALVLFAGVILVAYLAIGFAYFQQVGQQDTLQEQIARDAQVLSRPLPSADQLMADYHNITDNKSFLASIPDEETAFARIVEIAGKHGIDTDETSGKLRIPGVAASTIDMGGTKFKLLTFRGIHLQGDNASIMTLLADLDSGISLETLVLKRVSLRYEVIPFTRDESEQRAEFGAVSRAVTAMMADNGLATIPRPFAYSTGRATNFMGDDPATTAVVEGFPDNTTTAFEKGYTGNGSPRGGYVLYHHDKVITGNSSGFTTLDYFNTLNTRYYYTVEPDGTVRQFSGTDVTTAVEYPSARAPTIETIANIDIEIYTLAE